MVCLKMSDVKEKTGFWSSIPNDKKYLMIVLIGFMLLIFDQHITCSWLNGIYPAFKQYTGNTSDEFQLYTLNYLFGMKANIYTYTDGAKSIGEMAYNIKIDIFSDLLGYLLIAVALKKLSKKTKIFNIAVMTCVVASVLYIGIRFLPLIFNGQQLSHICFWMIIAQFGLEVCIGYMFVYGICDLLSGYQYVRDRKAIVLAWFTTVILNAVVMLLTWMAWFLNPAFYTFYNMFDLAVNILFFYFIYKDRDYILGYKKA